MIEICPYSHAGSYHQIRVCRNCGTVTPRLVGPAPKRAAATPAEAAETLQRWRARRKRVETRRLGRELHRAARIATGAVPVPADVLLRARRAKGRTTGAASTPAPTGLAPTGPAPTRFPTPIPGAAPNPVRARKVALELRRSDCAQQSACLSRAVRENWRGFSCADCAGYVRQQLELPARQSSADTGTYPAPEFCEPLDPDSVEDFGSRMPDDRHAESSRSELAGGSGRRRRR